MQPFSSLIAVDDDPTTGPLLEAALDGYFAVHSETSGALALTRIIEARPDLVILDLHMPNMDGFEVLRQLRHHPVTASIPVICMSGDASEPTRARAHALGAVVYLRKPLAFQNLAQDLSAVLGTVNAVVESDSKSRKFVIAFNEAEKARLIKEEIRLLAGAGGRVAVLSLMQGQEFCDPELESLIAADRLVFLQIRPSLLAKFPFLNSMGPIASELSRFTHAKTKDGVPDGLSLIWDNPLVLIQSGDSSGAVARLEALRESLEGLFSKSAFFCARGASSGSSLSINELATAFCRN